MNHSIQTSRIRGRVLKWNTVTQEKTSELGRYMNNQSLRIDFSEPSPILDRTDSRVVKVVILSLTRSEVKERTLVEGRSKKFRDASKGVWGTRDAVGQISIVALVVSVCAHN